MDEDLQNPNPQVFDVQDTITRSEEDLNEDNTDEIDALEIFDLIRKINDPEHPLSLEQINVVKLDQIQIDHKRNVVTIAFTPTVAHCNMATPIGLCIRVKLLRSLPKRYKIDINVSRGSHQSEDAVNKQLNDKVRNNFKILFSKIQFCLKPEGTRCCCTRKQ